jgi:hypothetical protein
VIEVHGFQVGAFVGRDHINEPNQADWIYQGERWISVGIGAAIFGATEDRAATGQ